jgi:outer membrane protein OmpA-like peptidoglycan-associated protein
VNPAREALDCRTRRGSGALTGNHMDRRAEQMREDPKNAKVERVGEGILVTFESGIRFDANEADLRPAAEDNIEELTQVLKRYDDTDVLVVGHTDATGSHEHNMELSTRRAMAVAEYATSHGLDADRITIEGQGETAPVAENDTAEGRQQNRRVEIAIYANEKMKKMVEEQS